MYSIKEIFPKVLAQYCDNKILSCKKKLQLYLHFYIALQKFFGILLEKMLENDKKIFEEKNK